MRYTALAPEPSLDVPDGTALITAKVMSPLGGSEDSGRDDAPELGVVIVLAPGAISTALS